MNKTVTVNIGGMVFHIEEHAYEKLKKYLEAIRGYFTTSEGRDEIILDIESRVAEIFTEKIGSSRQVVTDSDVEFMIDTMGRPEQVAGESDNDSTTSGAGSNTNYTGSDHNYRRLYRDPDDKVIGGVCSGISHYIGIDPLWLRLAFGIALFVYGSGFLLYLLLLIIIPKAKTTSEKLEMKGQPVNIDNIKRSIQDEVEDIKNRINGNTGNLKKTAGGTIARFFEAIGEIFVGFLKVFGKILGFILMLALLVIMIGLFVVALAVNGLIEGASIPSEWSSVFWEQSQINLGVAALFLVLGIPVLMLLFHLIRATFNIKGESKIVNYTSGILWVIGVLFSIWLGISISREFAVKDQNRAELPILQPKNNTLYLDGMNSNGYREYSYYDGDNEFKIDGVSFNDAKDTFRISSVRLDIVKAEGNEFELMKLSSGRGGSRKDAEKNTRAINYEILQEDSILKFSENYTLPKTIKFRNQKIQLVLKVPVGKSVFLADGIENIIYDIKNVTNTYDGNMIGHTWTMTDKGLKCIGCVLPEASENKNDHVHIKVNGKEVDINSDEDTINWDNKDVKIRLNGDGVVIDAKEKK